MLRYCNEVSWLVELPALSLTGLSPAAERLFGIGLDQARQLAAPLLLELPARLARFAEGDLSRLQLRREHALTLADGRRLALETESTLLTDAGGAVLALVGVTRDVSARQALAQQQQRFVSMLSHEFRTPLATIDGAVQRLESTGAHHDEATRKRYRKIQQAVDRLLAMLDDYLSPERMAGIGRQRQADSFAPAALLEAVAVQARSRRPQLQLHSAGLPAAVRGDPEGMRVCLEILIDNAIKYSGRDILIELIGKLSSCGEVELLVRDHGAGVPAAELDAIFDKTYRGSNAAGVAGAGLGLYMARAVVEVHGGSLTVRNVVGGGAEFRIGLPAARVAE